MLAVEAVHYAAKLTSMRRSVVYAFVSDVVVYHFVQQHGLIFTLRTVVKGAHTDGEIIKSALEQRAFASACHGAEACAGFRQTESRHGQFVAEVGGVELRKPLSEQIYGECHADSLRVA